MTSADSRSRYGALVRVVSLAGLASTAWGEPVQFIGGTLRVDQVNVAIEATFLGSDSLFTNELFLDDPITPGPLFISTSSPVGATAFLGPYSNAGQVLFIRNQSYLPSQSGGPASFNFGWFTGNGTLPLNPDRQPHAVFTYDTNNPTTVTVGFEDLFGGGDSDFDDAVYSFTNVRVDVVTTALTPDLTGLSSVASGEMKTFAGYEGTFTNSGTVHNDGNLFNYGEGTNDGEIQNLDNMLNDLPGIFTNNGQFVNEGEVRSFGTFIGAATSVITNSQEMQLGGETTNNGEIKNEIGASLSNIATGFLDTAGDVLNSGALTNLGTITNSGLFQNDSDGVLDNLNLGTLTNAPGGDLQIDGIFNNGGTFSNESIAKITGLMNNSGLLTNSGTVEFDREVYNTLIGEMQTTFNGVTRVIGTLTNDGSMSSLGEIQVEDGGELNNAGTLTIGPGGELQTSGVLNNIGTFTTEGLARITGIINNSGLLKNDGTVEFSGEAFNELIGEMQTTFNGVTRVMGTLTNDGTMGNVGQVEVEAGARLENIGTLANGEGGVIEINGDLKNLGAYSGAFSSLMNNLGIYTNVGTSTIDTGASMTGSGSYIQLDNGVTKVDGTLEQSIIDLAGGVLKGDGLIKGIMNGGSGLRLAPGNSPGTLTIEGSAFLTGTTLEIELASASLFDLLDVTEDVVFTGGTVEYMFDYTPSPGDRFVFLTAGGEITGLDTLVFDYSGNLGGLSFDTQLENSGGQSNLVLVVIPEPTGLVALSGCLLLYRRRRRPHVSKVVTSLHTTGC